MIVLLYINIIRLPFYSSYCIAHRITLLPLTSIACCRMHCMCTVYLYMRYKSIGIGNIIKYNVRVYNIYTLHTCTVHNIITIIYYLPLLITLHVCRR